MLMQGSRWLYLYLTVAIFSPVEPAHVGRTHPGRGPGERPDEWPVDEWLCQREVGQSMREGPTVPGELDGDVHAKIPEQR